MTHQSTQTIAERASSAKSLNVWLLSAYHTGSHKAWAEGYQRYSQHRVKLLTLSGRFWKWRMQGGSIALAAQARTGLTESPPSLQMPDVVVATDMVNLPAWVALMRGVLPATVPLVCYMHENQLTYPWRPGEKPDLTYAMINWLSQLSADLVLFNSQYHLENWFSELPRLLKHYPDYAHLELVEVVRTRSAVTPVGIDIGLPTQQSPDDVQRMLGAPLILWNQRWEYDKRPDRFFALLYRLQEAQVEFRLAVAGENFRNVPHEFEEAKLRLASHIVHWGFAPTRPEYLNLLQQADMVISTADHEFFGISILEAVAAGAFPLLPNRLSYPELIPTALHPACLYVDDDELWHKTVRFLTALPKRPRPVSQVLREHLVSTYGWPVPAQQLDHWISTVAARKSAYSI